MKTGEEAGTLAEDAAPADANMPHAASAPEGASSTDKDSVGQDTTEEAAGQDPADRDSADLDATKPGRRAGAPVWTAVMALLVVALIVGLVTAAGYHSRVGNYNAQASNRQAAIAVATTAVTDLTTADYKDPTQYVDKLKPLAVGNFLSLFTNSASGFQDVLVQGKVQTTGRVAYVGVQRMGTGTAQLTVLAYVTVKNSQTPKGSQRVYRLAVSMIQSGSQWLVSNVEFVQ